MSRARRPFRIATIGHTRFFPFATRCAENIFFSSAPPDSSAKSGSRICSPICRRSAGSICSSAAIEPTPRSSAFSASSKNRPCSSGSPNATATNSPNFSERTRRSGRRRRQQARPGPRARSTQQRLSRSLDVIVNSSGLTDFNPDLRDALAMNVRSTAYVLDFSANLRSRRAAASFHLLRGRPARRPHPRRTSRRTTRRAESPITTPKKNGSRSKI